MPEIFKVHAHDVVTFQRCRRKDYYSRIRGWEVPSLGRNVEIGSMFHDGLAALYRKVQDGEPFPRDCWVDLDDFFTEAVEDFAINRLAQDQVVISDEDVNLAVDMLNFYWQNFGCRDTIKRIVSVEQDIIVPFEINGRKYEVSCKPDLIFEDESGNYILRDHKTKDVLPSDYSWFDMDPQMMLYQLAARVVGARPCTVEHNLVRREVPPGFGHRPTHNSGIDKNGKAWTRKSTASTEPTDYVRSYRFAKSDATLDAYEAEVESILEEMGNAPQNLRSPSMLCTSCSYFIPCNRELAGDRVSDAEASLLFNLTLH